MKKFEPVEFPSSDIISANVSGANIIHQYPTTSSSENSENFTVKQNYSDGSSTSKESENIHVALNPEMLKSLSIVYMADSKDFSEHVVDSAKADKQSQQ